VRGHSPGFWTFVKLIWGQWLASICDIFQLRERLLVRNSTIIGSQRHGPPRSIARQRAVICCGRNDRRRCISCLARQGIPMAAAKKLSRTLWRSCAFAKPSPGFGCRTGVRAVRPNPATTHDGAPRPTTLLRRRSCPSVATCRRRCHQPCGFGLGGKPSHQPFALRLRPWRLTKAIAEACRGCLYGTSTARLSGGELPLCDRIRASPIRCPAIVLASLRSTASR